MEPFSKDLLIKKIRDGLNAKKIKLWLPPYTNDDNKSGHIPKELIEEFSSNLHYPAVEVAQCLDELRLHALSKLEERKKFETQGLATLRVKITCQQAENVPNKPVPVECQLKISGAEFRSLLGTKFELPSDNLRLICQGKVVDDTRSLSEQGVRNGSDVMAMCMTTLESEVAQKEMELAEVERTKQAAQLLSSRSDDDDHFDIQIADQKGQPLHLPKEEKKALTLAMTLHEKGRAALKDKKVSLALPLLLEADEEFNKCRAEILNSVDNYAILCLDIVWCYFLLKNLEQLPNAEKRLRASEECFKRSYGERMERLAAIKGGTGMEQALFMRLYLLQGIVAFHKGETSDARNFLRRAEFVLGLLHVDEDKLTEVMAMGFTEREARLGLRAKNGNISQAIDYIMEKRREKEEINKKVKTEWNQRIRAKKLGKTASGEPVNIKHYDYLIAMGFPNGASAEALRQSNNNIEVAIEILNTQPELLTLPDPEQKKVHITDDMLQQILGLGFEPDVARQALELFRGNIERAVDELIRNGGHLPISPDVSSSSSASSATSATSETTETQEERRQRLKREDEELSSLVADISTDENDHLDLTLTEEREVLLTYQGMLESLPGTS